MNWIPRTLIIAVFGLLAANLAGCGTFGIATKKEVAAGLNELAAQTAELSARKADAKDVSALAGIVATKADKAEAAKLQEEIAALSAGKADKALVEAALVIKADAADVKKAEAAVRAADKKVGDLAKRVATTESRTAQLGASRAKGYIREIQTKFRVPDGSRLVHFWGFPSGGSDFEALALKSAKVKAAAAALKEEVKGGAEILFAVGFEDMVACPKGAGEDCLKVAERRAQSAAKYFSSAADKIKSLAPTADFGWDPAESRRVIIVVKPAPPVAVKAPAPATTPAIPAATSPAPLGSKP